MTVYAKSPAAANFMSMFVEEELEINSPLIKTPKGYSVELSETDAEDMISCAEEYNDIGRDEWQLCEDLEECKKNTKRSLKENTSTKDRVFVAPRTMDAKEALEDFGISNSGFIYELTAGELGDLIENTGIDPDEIDVKDENGEPIEDVYSFAFDTDEIYDEYNDDFEDDDDEIYFEPGEGDEYFLDDEDDLDF